jgi:hypothetical protein
MPLMLSNLINVELVKAPFSKTLNRWHDPIVSMPTLDT